WYAPRGTGVRGGRAVQDPYRAPRRGKDRRLYFREGDRMIRCPIVWHTLSNFMGIVVAPDGTKLAVTLTGQPGSWAVSTIETDGESAEEVFASHAHEIIGSYKRFSRAEAAGMRYATTWLAKRRKLAKCGCGPIKKGERRVPSRHSRQSS